MRKFHHNFFLPEPSCCHVFPTDISLSDWPQKIQGFLPFSESGLGQSVPKRPWHSLRHSLHSFTHPFIHSRGTGPETARGVLLWGHLSVGWPQSLPFRHSPGAESIQDSPNYPETLLWALVQELRLVPARGLAFSIPVRKGCPAARLRDLAFRPPFPSHLQLHGCGSSLEIQQYQIPYK